MYTRGGKSTVEKPTLVNKPKIYKGRLGEVREARGGKSTKPTIVPKMLFYDSGDILTRILILYSVLGIV